MCPQRDTRVEMRRRNTDGNRFYKLSLHALHHWGLRLTRCGETGDRSVWKTGYALEGIFPGSGHEWRRYATLAEVASVIKFTERNAGL